MQHIQRGMKFLHKRVIEPETKKPMHYVVTKVTSDDVYFCPVDGGSSEFCPIETFEPRIVGEWIRDEVHAAE